MRIDSKELNFVYGAKSSVFGHALKGVNLQILEGEFFGIIGKTGSGKSTFIQHLNGLLKVQKDSGNLTVGEFDLTDKNCKYKELRKKVGMVFQYPEHQLFSETVSLDVAFGVKNFMPELSDAQVTEMVKSAIELVGLDYEKLKDQSPFELSGGQKRRVAIAGVIASRPEILVLDEPAAGLDPKGKREFISLLHRLHRSFIKTIIIVSHDMNLISENCTSVAVFDDGKVELCGTPEQVFTSPDFSKTGLRLPLVAELENKIKSLGVDFSCNLTVDDFVDKISSILGGKL